MIVATANCHDEKASKCGSHPCMKNMPLILMYCLYNQNVTGSSSQTKKKTFVRCQCLYASSVN